MKGSVNYYARQEDEENYFIQVGGNGNKTFMKMESTEVSLVDVRDGEPLKFSQCGLEYATFPTKVKQIGDSLDEYQKKIYEGEIENLLKSKIDDIAEMFVFDYTIRDLTLETRKPARHVHVDYKASSAEQRMRDMLGNERADSWLADGGQFGIVNVWRPLDYPVEKDPLAFIDPKTINQEESHVLRIHNPGRIATILGIEKRANHRWLVLDKMDPDMVWIFNQFDSRGMKGLAHSAVDLLDVDTTARKRKSIECRVLIRYHN